MISFEGIYSLELEMVPCRGGRKFSSTLLGSSRWSKN